MRYPFGCNLFSYLNIVSKLYKRNRGFIQFHNRFLRISFFYLNLNILAFFHYLHIISVCLRDRPLYSWPMLNRRFSRLKSPLQSVDCGKVYTRSPTSFMQCALYFKRCFASQSFNLYIGMLVAFRNHCRHRLRTCTQ